MFPCAKHVVSKAVVCTCGVGSCGAILEGLLLCTHDCQDRGSASGPTLIKALVQSDLWHMADMNSVLDYLSKNKYVHCPDDFVDVLFDGC